jgi:predicted nucleotidyltransferase
VKPERLAVQRQAQDLGRRLSEALGGMLVGVYVHGSVALDTFRSGLSDLDVIAVARRRTNVAEKRLLVEILAEADENPAELEFHFLAEPDLDPWRHPAPFDFHYSDNWRGALRSDLEHTLTRQGDTDPDLAAHLTVVRARGIPVQGPPPTDVFPVIPWNDYVDALLRDLKWVGERGTTSPVYCVLSPARVWATLATREIHSKDSGGAWAVDRLPANLRPVLAGALARYRGETDEFSVDPETLKQFLVYVEAEVRPIAAS